MFRIDPAFESGSAALCDLPLCAVRLQLDARCPWLILIPRVSGAVELANLAPAERAQLTEEAVLAGQAVRDVGAVLGRPVEKLNVAMLGNVTRQLHAHIVGRRADDFAWPAPVWGVGEAEPLDPEALELSRQAVLKRLG
ncbi:MAG TPA: HIT domain-containing protein [Caulobacteraceae bacterium]|jgi:diadenosine tetraphosphate (Ap4A) HIT family hydrolase|nr:HIT domain-containing protein [Caulobacteraceae bacterium]